jgi:hypothetical protein
MTISPDTTKLNQYDDDRDEIIDAEIDTETDVDKEVTGPRTAMPATTPDAPYLRNGASDDAHDRWSQVQAGFVDDPRRSVSEAHKLVSDLVQEIVDEFTHERDNLERQWSSGDQVSTEDLRVCLQRYRTFFSKLLPSRHADGVEHAA